MSIINQFPKWVLVGKFYFASQSKEIFCGICLLHKISSETCFFPAAQVKDVKRRFPTLLHSLDGDPCHSKNTRVIQILELSEGGHTEIRACLSRKVVASVAHLHQCAQLRQPTGGAGSQCAVGKLWHSYHHGNLVQRCTQLDHSNRWL